MSYCLGAVVLTCICQLSVSEDSLWTTNFESHWVFVRISEAQRLRNLHIVWSYTVLFVSKVVRRIIGRDVLLKPSSVGSNSRDMAKRICDGESSR
jgi:hypothetical protein